MISRAWQSGGSQALPRSTVFWHGMRNEHVASRRSRRRGEMAGAAFGTSPVQVQAGMGGGRGKNRMDEA